MMVKADHNPNENKTRLQSTFFLEVVRLRMDCPCMNFTQKSKNRQPTDNGGIKLLPEQIEEKLSGRIDGRFYVIGKPDHDLGEKLVLVVEGEARQLNPDTFAVLDKYEKPKEILFVPQFRETATHKILREIPSA